MMELVQIVVGLALFASFFLVPFGIFALYEYLSGPPDVAAQRAKAAEARRVQSEMYHRYLASDHWKAKADEAKGRAGNKCERCGSRKWLEVHHKTYKKVYRERPQDLEVLCSRCHRNHHFGEH